MTCHRYRAKGMEQIMDQLPKARLNKDRPFTHCGVDYAGPITIKTSKEEDTNAIKDI